MITQLRLSFQPVESDIPLLTTAVSGSQLHGLLFSTLLPAVSDTETTWLHEHASPKPFALAPITERSGSLTGLRVSCLSDRAADLILTAIEHAKTLANPIRLGDHHIKITGLQQDKAIPFVNLLKLHPQRNLTLHFLTPTAFKQGPRRLHLPVPVNVFDRPAAIWRMYAPPAIQLPSDWLDWCEANVYVLEHHIHTTKQAINARGTFAGFVGKVQFISADADETYLRLWQGLGRLASYCGVGSKTTMGMGVVAWSRRASERKASADQKEIA
jgi:CRISPR-associated endoribonuclease Cas6